MRSCPPGDSNPGLLYDCKSAKQLSFMSLGNNNLVLLICRKGRRCSLEVQSISKMLTILNWNVYPKIPTAEAKLFSKGPSIIQGRITPLFWDWYGKTSKCQNLTQYQQNIAKHERSERQMVQRELESEQMFCLQNLSVLECLSFSSSSGKAPNVRITSPRSDPACT